MQLKRKTSCEDLDRNSQFRYLKSSRCGNNLKFFLLKFPFDLQVTNTLKQQEYRKWVHAGRVFLCLASELSSLFFWSFRSRLVRNAIGRKTNNLTKTTI